MGLKYNLEGNADGEGRQLGGEGRPRYPDDDDIEEMMLNGDVD